MQPTPALTPRRALKDEQTIQPTLSRLAEALIEHIHHLLEAGRFDDALDLFNDLDPADQGDIFADLGDEDRERLLAALSPEDSAQIVAQLEPEEAVDMFGEVETTALSGILDEARPDIAADVLRQLPDEQTQETLEAMRDVEDVLPLLEHPDDSAGGLMTPDFLSVRQDIAAGSALDSIRIRGPEAADVGWVFVLDGDGRLTGGLGVVKLALSRPSNLVSEIMDGDIISVPVETDREECARLMERYDLRQLAVVDVEKRLLGVILIEDVVDVLDEEATEDMYSIAGIGGERIFGTLTGSVRRRLPWLYVNLATTILAASVISLFESTIARVVTLAVFLPVVAGQGGIGGTQTLTLVVRSMALGDVPGRRALRLVGRELMLGLLHGVLLGVVVALVVYAWQGNGVLGLIVGVAMLGNMLIAGLAGAAVPLILRALKTDPAVGSAVVVTTLTDVVGFALFLGVAAALINHLT